MTRVTNRFERGSAVYACRTCGRNTRSTGRGDNEGVLLCEECYDLGGEENHLSDNGGEFYSSPTEVLNMIAAVGSKGGDASVWDDLKARATAAYNPEYNNSSSAGLLVEEADKAPVKSNSQSTSKATTMSTITIHSVTKANVSELNSKDLLALFNAHAPKAVAKFADRKTAEARLLKLAAEVAESSLDGTIQAAKAAKVAAKAAAKAPAKKVAVAKEPKAPRAPKEPKVAVSRSDAIAQSWTNPATKAKRSERSHVVVDKVEYRSVLQAFEELGLDVKKHIAFRLQLKASEGGKLAFAGKVFKLVAAGSIE